jgi:hypothetical protein
LNNVVQINGNAASPTVPVNTYTCSAINLSNTASAASAYRITINKTDASGNVLTGSSAYTNTTGLIASTPPATIDIKALYGVILARHQVRDIIIKLIFLYRIFVRQAPYPD